jgi:hypothetical protein
MNEFYILAMIFAVGTMLFTFMAAKRDDQEIKTKLKKPKNKPKPTYNKLWFFLSIVCTVITMVFTYIATKQDGQVTEDSLKLEITRRDELLEKVLRNTQQITGDGSFPIAYPFGGQDNGDKTQIIISLEGEFALHNLTAKVVVIPDYSNVSGLDARILGIQNNTLDIGTIRKSGWKDFLVETKTKETAIIIYFKTDNYSWTESIRINKTKEGRKVMWYIQDQNGEYLLKKIDQGFPINENGEIKLWSNVSKKTEEL